jgi:hypothetical protein
MFRRPPVLLGIAAGLVVITIAAVVFLGGRDQASVVAEKGPSFTFDQALEHPLDDGRQLPLDQARPLIPFEIPLPHHDLANPDNLATTWISTNNHVALRFATDVLIIMQTPDFENAAVEFAELIASGSVKNGRLDLVGAQTALVMEPDTDVDGENPGSLQFVRDGVSITLYGRDLEGSALKAIAETL